MNGNWARRACTAPDERGIMLSVAGATNDGHDRTTEDTVIHGTTIPAGVDVLQECKTSWGEDHWMDEPMTAMYCKSEGSPIGAQLSFARQMWLGMLVSNVQLCLLTRARVVYSDDLPPELKAAVKCRVPPRTELGEQVFDAVVSNIFPDYENPTFNVEIAYYVEVCRGGGGGGGGYLRLGHLLCLWEGCRHAIIIVVTVRR